jgi:2',3'-cyclic-nucleotide 2'-phosphodiesterase (5'-nucleotidase family)
VQVGGEDLDLDKTYKLATNDYILGGGDGYSALGGARMLIDAANGNLMANDVIDYVLKNGGVTASVEGRIKTVGN